LLLFSIDQNGLLPGARRLIGAMNATCPAAGPLLSLQQFACGSLHTTLARFWLFGVVDPADELITTEGRQAAPQSQDRGIRLDCGLKVVACCVDSALRKIVRHQTSELSGPPA
jgi:hypothetical protein